MAGKNNIQTWSTVIKYTCSKYTCTAGSTALIACRLGGGFIQSEFTGPCDLVCIHTLLYTAVGAREFMSPCDVTQYPPATVGIILYHRDVTTELYHCDVTTDKQHRGQPHHWTHLATRMRDLVVLWTLKQNGSRETAGSSTCMPYMGISSLNL